MKNFNQAGRFNKPRGGRNFGSSQMHAAVCDDCGKNCQVPFTPTSGKPIYCSNCFEKRSSGRSDFKKPSYIERKNFSAPQSRPQKDYDKQFEAVNLKLDKIFKILAAQKITPEIIPAVTNLAEVSKKLVKKKLKPKTPKTSVTEI